MDYCALGAEGWELLIGEIIFSMRGTLESVHFLPNYRRTPWLLRF